MTFDIDNIIRRARNLQYKSELLFQRFGKYANQTIDTVTIIVAVWCVGNIVWQIGFSASGEMQAWLLKTNRYCIVFFAIVQCIKLLNYTKGRFRMPVSEIVYAVLTCTYISLTDSESTATEGWQYWLNHRYTACAVLVLLSINEISRLGITILGKRTSPTILFVGSFLFIIIIGTGLLLMPRCSTEGLTFVDALFTSTSAVCVTGLSVIDITAALTPYGRLVLLLLFQLGGIGVMTFTCFFALSITGKASFQNRMVIKDLVSAANMNDIFTTLKRIVLVTVTMEFVSAWLIYHCLSNAMPDAQRGQLAFDAVFHAVAAFCNAGFSTFDGGLTNPVVAGNKMLQFVLILTILIGGIGFPLQSSVLDWFKYHIHGIFLKIIGRRNETRFRSRLINANIRLIFYTHIALFVFGTLFFMFSEMRHSQAEMSFASRLSESAFMSAVARSAGFNSVPMSAISPIGIAMLAMLMWVGCAPLSTGGGIKVTTFAIALLNVKNVLLRKDHIEIFNRRVSDSSVRKAFATIVLSLVAIGASALAMKIADPHLPIVTIAFEACSAFSTTGLSLDATMSLSAASKFILLFDMFVGRIGILAFLACFIAPGEKQYYKYPSEDVMI